MKRDLVLSFVSNGLIFLMGLFVFKLAARDFGPAGFGEYTIGRRAISFVLPVLLIGLNVGLTRYIAISDSKGRKNSNQVSYIVAGYGSVLLFSLLVLLVVNVFPDFFGRAIYGKPGYTVLVRSVSLLAEVQIIHELVFVYFRGKGNFVAAIILNILSTGVMPLAALLFSGSVSDILVRTAVLLFLVNGTCLFFILRDVVKQWHDVEISGPLRELMRFGLARMPGDVCMAGIFALPTFLTANTYGVREAGYVGFSVSLVTMIGAVFAPIHFIMLPKLSALFSESRVEEARTIIKRIIKYSLAAAVAITGLVIIFAGQIVVLWLGRDFADSAGIIRLVVIAAVPYALHVALMSSIDAAHEKAVNASNLYKALAAAAVVYFITGVVNFATIGVPVSFVFGIAVLGFLTIKVSLASYGLKYKWVFDLGW